MKKSETFESLASSSNLVFSSLIYDLHHKFLNSRSHYVNFIVSNDDNELTIQIKLKRETKINPFDFDLVFYIIIDYYYPESVPYVRSLTNFTKPTLFDGRNLLYSIICQNWTKESNIMDIIDGLPEFIERIKENYDYKILVFYGDYQLDKVYDMNEIILNSHLNFYKINQKLSKEGKNYSKERFIVVTDLYLLLFDPVSHSKNMGRLLFLGDLRQINNNKRKGDLIELEWIGINEENKTSIKFEFSDYFSIKKFFERVENKKTNLKENFKIFQDDLSKPTSDGDLLLDEENLLLHIKFKEGLLSKKFSMNIVKELMNLYKKIIEITSAKHDDNTFTIYLEKLQNMLKNENNFEELRNSLTFAPKKKDHFPIITNHIKQESIFRLSQQAFSTLNAEIEDEINE